MSQAPTVVGTDVIREQGFKVCKRKDVSKGDKFLVCVRERGKNLEAMAHRMIYI
jgi:hypothetical protein